MAKPNPKRSPNDVAIQSEVKQWGNSLGVRIPKEIRGNLNLFDGAKIVISLNQKSKKIIIENLSKKHSIYDLAQDLNLSVLTKKMTKKNCHKKAEIFSGIVGKEIW